MKTRHFALTILTAVVVIGIVAPAVAEAGNNIVVTLRGSLSGLMTDPPIEDAFCYEAELVNTKTDHVIGTGIDCLENPVLFDSDGNEHGFELPFPFPAPSIALDRTTFFFFPQGTVVAGGRTTVSPIFQGSPGPMDPPDHPGGPTHIVGDITGPGGDNIQDDLGTGRFRDKTGRVRLSGAVDMTSFPSDIIFNCIFVIDLDD